MSTYTRVYPIDDKSYNPSDNPSIKGRCQVTSSSGDILVGPAPYAAASAGWVVTIYEGQANPAVIGSYAIGGVSGGDTFTLTELDGTPWVAPASSDGAYDFIVFDPSAPTGNDTIPEAVMFDTLPATGMEVILSSGQYLILDPAVFVVNAVYSISIMKVLNRDGASGYLLGRDGVNGRSFIRK